LLVGMRRYRDARIRLRNDVAVVFVPAVAPAKKKAPVMQGAEVALAMRGRGR
jgi:hypothetical protein